MKKGDLVMCIGGCLRINGSLVPTYMGVKADSWQAFQTWDASYPYRSRKENGRWGKWRRVQKEGRSV